MFSLEFCRVLAKTPLHKSRNYHKYSVGEIKGIDKMRNNGKLMAVYVDDTIQSIRICPATLLQM